MSNNVTYLLGAGASAKSLPTLNEINPALNAVINFLTKNGIDQEIINDLRKLRDASAEQQSIDTYAKMLWLRGDYKTQIKVKHLIVLFFELFEYMKKVGEPTYIWNFGENTQKEKQQFDNRYDAFLAGILYRGANGGLAFPKHINVLSWNYDYEFEKAVIKYINKKYVEDCYYNLDFNVIHKKVYKNISQNMSLVKINGFIGFWRTANYDRKEYPLLGYYSAIVNYDKIDFNIENIINFYKANNTRASYNPAISFAWESINDNNAIKHAKDIMKETDVLVVIGYSFPYFNREIDKELLSLENAPKLRKIYIQDRNAANIEETIRGFRDLWEIEEEYRTNIL